jgi:cytochrome c oxidase assembly protein Cox11
MGRAGNRNTLRRDLLVALQCGAFAALTGSVCCAAMPLWSRLCGGLGGTAEVAGALARAPHLASVRFDRDLAARLGFRPPNDSVAANFNQVVTVSFRIAGPAGRIGAAEAGCGVGAPGLCLEKINCLYLVPQTVRPGERVVLCVDPNRADDPGRDRVGTVTLFHTDPGGARRPVRARLTGRT